MEILTGAASSTLSEIGKRMWSIAANNIKYLLCYDRKVEELKQLVQNLDEKKKVIQARLEAETRNGRTLDAHVSRWLTNSDLVEKDAMSLEKQVKDVRCSMSCCWNCFSYKIGKEAAEKINTAKLLLSAEFTIYSHEPPPPSIESRFPNRDFQESLSTKSSMELIWEALNNEFFNIIGVYGMGGVGKTTIMEEIAKRAKNEGQYNEVIRVTVSQNQDVKKMQTEIAEQLGFPLTAESEMVRGAKLLDRIKGARKILIILDDLWDFLNISTIGIPSADENKECKVVITTRSRDVSSSMGCQQHIKVEPLSEEESWDLFKSKVGDVVEKTDDLKKVAVDVAKECGGLPLAIITLGRAMREKDDIDTWNSVLYDLQQAVQTHIIGMEDSVLKCLRKSFDFLKSDEAKLCFLLCSLFPEDWQIDITDFFRYVVGEGILRHVYSMEATWKKLCPRLLDELKDCSLLLEGKDSEHFKMHDVVRDVAIWISSDKTYGFYGFANKGLRQWPEISQVDECQRIYFTGNSFDSLPAEPLVYPKLRTMILKETQISTIPDGFFQRMEALLVLDLRSVWVASLPSSFPCLVNLKALFLIRSRFRHIDFDVTSLSLIGELKNLDVLQLEGFEFGTVPKEFGNLTKLRCLDLLGCTGTIPRNLISRLSILEQLYLTGVFSNWQVDDEGSSSTDAATFAELASLSCLTTLHVDIENPDVFLQLNFVPWPALTDFKIVVGRRFLWSSSFGPSRRRSKQLAITKSTYNYKWVRDLVAKTERLGLNNWPGMECLIGGGAEEEGLSRPVGNKLFEVRALYLDSMPDMKSLCSGTLLPDDILLRKLSVLVIQDCHKLIDVLLPTCMLLRTHQLMERLEISRCYKLEKVLSLTDFVQEEEGEGGQSAIEAGGIVLLPRLRSIILEDLPELRSVWGDDGHGGVMIMLAAGSLQNLQSLQVWRCKSLKDGHMLPPILPIPNKLDHFPSLRILNIRGCHSLTYLLSWRQAKGLPHLESLYVVDCKRMKTVVIKEEGEGGQSAAEAGGIVLLPRLQSIHLEELPELRSVWGDGVIMLPAGSLQNLESLQVRDCKSLKDDRILPPILPIPNKLDHFPCLRELWISGCHSLTYLLSWRQAKGQLPHLQKLNVWNCERMETVVIKEEPEEEVEEESHVLPSLTHLHLRSLPMLRSFFQGEQCSKPLSSLKHLHVVECPKLKKLPLSSSSSPPVNLQRLEGDSWEWFESLEWGEDQSIKERLRPLFQPIPEYIYKEKMEGEGTVKDADIGIERDDDEDEEEEEDESGEEDEGEGTDKDADIGIERDDDEDEEEEEGGVAEQEIQPTA